MFIPTGMRYTATVSGSAWKPITCEGCGAQYAYKVTRKVSGTGRSALFLDNDGAKERARKGAYSALDQALNSAAEPVPCPACSRFHSSMFGRLASKRYGYMTALAIVSLVAGALTVALYVGVVFILLGIGLFIWQSQLKKAYDPNEDLERATKAATPAPPTIRRAEYDEVMQAALAKGVDRSTLQEISWNGEAPAAAPRGAPPSPAHAPVPAPIATAAAPERGGGNGLLGGGIVLALFAAMPVIGSMVSIALPLGNPLAGSVCGAVNLLVLGVPAGLLFRAWAKRRSGTGPNWLIFTPIALAALFVSAGGLRYALLTPQQLAELDKKETPAPSPVAATDDEADEATADDSKGGLATVEVGDDEAARLEFDITAVSQNQRPTQRPPWHAAGGDWTFLDCATRAPHAAHFSVGLQRKGAVSSPISFGKARLAFDDAAARERFVQAFAGAFHARAPSLKKPASIEPFEMGTAELGHGMVRSAGGGFTSGNGTWAASKWFPQRGKLEAEVFFNYSLSDKQGAFSEKDSSYREDLAALF